MPQSAEQLDFFRRPAPNEKPVRDAAVDAAGWPRLAPRTGEPVAALRGHLEDPSKLSLAALKAVLEAVAGKIAGTRDDAAADLLCRLCERHAAHDRDFGPCEEVTLALNALAGLAHAARRKAAARLQACKALAPERLPPVLKAESAALDRADPERLRACLDSPDPEQRMAACRIVADAGVTRLLENLARMATDPEPGVRKAALLARGILGNSAARPELENRLAGLIQAGTARGPELQTLLEALWPVANEETAVLLRRLPRDLSDEDRTAVNDLLEALAEYGDSDS